MQEFTQSLSFIIFFLILTLICQMVFGETVTTRFLWLVLASMVILNQQKFTRLLERVKMG